MNNYSNSIKNREEKENKKVEKIVKILGAIDLSLFGLNIILNSLYLNI